MLAAAVPLRAGVALGQVVEHVSLLVPDTALDRHRAEHFVDHAGGNTGKIVVGLLDQPRANGVEFGRHDCASSVAQCPLPFLWVTLCCGAQSVAIPRPSLLRRIRWTEGAVVSGRDSGGEWWRVVVKTRFWWRVVERSPAASGVDGP
jgi:hypothetical protein